MYATSHKNPFLPSVEVSDYYDCIGRKQSEFCETFAKVTNWVTDPIRWLCELFQKACG